MKKNQRKRLVYSRKHDSDEHWTQITESEYIKAAEEHGYSRAELPVYFHCCDGTYRIQRTNKNGDLIEPGRIRLRLPP